MLMLSHLWPVRATSFWLLCLFDRTPLAFGSIFVLFFSYQTAAGLIAAPKIRPSCNPEPTKRTWFGKTAFVRVVVDFEMRSVWIKVGPCLCSAAPLCQLFVTPWAVACQAPLSIDFSRQQSWSGLPYPTPAFLFLDATWFRLIWYFPVPVLESAVSLSEEQYSDIARK